MAVMPPETLDALAAAVTTRVVARLAGRLPAEAKAMADAAAEVPGLDPVAVLALADWLEERKLDGIAGDVRRMAADDGDVFVIQPVQHLHGEAMAMLRETARRLEDRIRATGRQVVVAVLPYGVTLSYLPAEVKG